MDALTDFNLRCQLVIFASQACADPEFCQRASNFDYFFLVDEGREDPNTTISGPSLARQRNAILMAFRWRADDGPTLNAGFVALWFSEDPGQYC